MEKIDLQFLALVARMREAQKAYFLSKVNGRTDYEVLKTAKHLESRCDDVLEKYYYSNLNQNGKQN